MDKQDKMETMGNEREKERERSRIALRVIPCLLFRHGPLAELLLLPSFHGTVPEGRAFREVLSPPSDLCHPSDPRTQDPYFPFLPFALATLSDPE